MTEAVRRCDAHGFVAGERCPACGAGGGLVLAGDRRRQLSTYMSGALRHFPDDADLVLDDRGWTPLSALVATVADRYAWADRAAVLAVVATDPKGRFELDGVGPNDDGPDSPEAGGDPAPTAGGAERRSDRAADADDRVRAAYGHSVDVTLAPGDGPVPDTLYHGSAPRNREAILAPGLRPMARQQVRLSATLETARQVGRRHADEPVVFVVNAAGLAAAGHAITKRGRGVYTTDRVPPTHLQER